MSQKIWWRKIGGGSFRLKGGKIIKPNQRFLATKEDIPDGFRDVVVPCSEIPEEKPLEAETNYEIISEIVSGDEIIASECEEGLKYFMVTETKDGDKEIEVTCTKVNKKSVVFSCGEDEYKLPSDEIVKATEEFYSVANEATGKRVNDSPLSLKEANDLLESLS